MHFGVVHKVFHMGQPYVLIKKVSMGRILLQYGYQTTINMTPFEVVYSMLPRSLLSYIPGSAADPMIDAALRTRDQLLAELHKSISCTIVNEGL